MGKTGLRYVLYVLFLHVPCSHTYPTLLRLFVNGMIAAPDFETPHLFMFKSDSTQHSKDTLPWVRRGCAGSWAATHTPPVQENGRRRVERGYGPIEARTTDGSAASTAATACSGRSVAPDAQAAAKASSPSARRTIASVASWAVRR